MLEISEPETEQARDPARSNVLYRVPECSEWGVGLCRLRERLRHLAGEIFIVDARAARTRLECMFFGEGGTEKLYEPF